MRSAAPKTQARPGGSRPTSKPAAGPADTTRDKPTQSIEDRFLARREALLQAQGGEPEVVDEYADEELPF
jgi:hypothetical protein